MDQKVQDVEISALNGDGIDDLMESLLLETDVLELKSNKECNASGVIIDSRLDKGSWPYWNCTCSKRNIENR